MAVRSGQELGRPAHGRKSARRLDRIPFRRKLDALIALPAIGIAALLTPLVSHQVDTARTWQDAASYMSVTEQVSALIDDLGIEQEDGLGVVSSLQLVGINAFDRAAAATDRQKVAVMAAYHNNPPRDMKAALAEVDALGGPRSQVHSGSINGTILLQSYTSAMNDLNTAMDLLRRTSNPIPSSVPAAELNLLFQSDLASNEREAALMEIADAPSEAPTQYPLAEQFSGVAIASAAWLRGFIPDNDFALFQSVGKNVQQQTIDTFESAVTSAFVSGSKLGLDQLTAYSRSVSDAALALGQARASMESTITQEVVHRAQHSASVAAWTAVILVAVALALLIGLILLSVTIRHSVARPVLRLTRAATRIATVAEQDLQRVADDDPGQEGAPELEHVAIATRDEIGDLAESFNRLQETAVRVLERQVLIRRNTAEMFGNVGRRIYNLTGRQLALIDAMERSETDPVLLERLYRIDHLAVRLQRGADSLVLLSGEREPAVDATPMRLTDVVRSAIGRIEGYQRVVLGAEGDSMVTPSAIGDLTLMIAELVENAVAFSPTSSTVDVAVRSVSRGAVVEIVDRGVGMTTQRLMQENELLVRRERLDLMPTKVLGLFVVGRLAQRTGAQVTLSQTAGGGLTARVTVPDELLLGPVELAERVSGGGAPAPRTVPTPPMPEQRRDRETPVAAGLPQRVAGANRQQREGSMAQRPPTLPRRVRGATAPTPTSGGRQGVSLAPAAALDPEEARAAIEEFEAGVDQALRDSARGLPVRPPGAAEHAPPAAGDTDEEKGERL